MTCDEVFDMLTRGPFPSGAANDELVEDHLASCVECRRLATALQPAVDLLREAVDCDEGARLPEYTGRTIRPVADSLTARDAEAPQHPSFESGLPARQPDPRGDVWRRRVAPQRRNRGQPASARPASHRLGSAMAQTNLFRFAAAVLLGVALAAGGRELVASRAVSTPVASASAPRTAASPVAPTRISLAALALPRACTPPPKQPVEADQPAINRAEPLQLAAADLSLRQECCTECHTWAKGGLTSAEGRAVLVRACSACHQ